MGAVGQSTDTQRIECPQPSDDTFDELLLEHMTIDEIAVFQQTLASISDAQLRTITRDTTPLGAAPELAETPLVSDYRADVAADGYHYRLLGDPAANQVWLNAIGGYMGRDSWYGPISIDALLD